MLYSKDPRETKQSETILFDEIVHVEKAELNITTSERFCPQKHKFVLQTKKRVYELYTSLEEQREQWIFAFCRVIDSVIGVEYSESAVKSITYENFCKRQIS